MSRQSWGQVRDCMRTNVTEVEGTLDVLSALKIMKEVGATSLIVKRRDDRDEHGLLLFSDIAKKVIAKDGETGAVGTRRNGDPLLRPTIREFWH